jgi:HK97 family phage major capsid protein
MSGGKAIDPQLMDYFDPVGGGFKLPQAFAPSAALYEGSGSAGGYAVPIVVDDQIVPLAPQEMSVRQLAQVIPTTMDIKFPTKSTFSTATAKAETSSFTESEPTISQFTLSAYMAGVLQEISWELAQDVPAFQAFAVDDMILAQQMYEENLYVNGTGSGQAQGLIGNVGAGYGPQEPDTNGNMVSVAGILNLIGTLNEYYHANASFLMARPTSVGIRKAQMQSNLFFPAFTSIGGQDYLFGYPVKYSAYMPAASRGNSPVIFGDFKRGYIIGDRGGSGINVKVLDQPLASQGLIQLLAYRRTDGRVRRSEALQSYTISAS